MATQPDLKKCPHCGGLLEGEAAGHRTSSYPAEFEAIWAIYPQRQGGDSKADAFKKWQATVRRGASKETLQQAVIAYTEFLRKTRALGTEYVLRAATFFGPGEHWKRDWRVKGKDSAARQDYSKDGRDGILGSDETL
jgi:hypothetical protein